ncbi:hypothetical protein Tco_1447611 [Tanacetum coccineum]
MYWFALEGVNFTLLYHTSALAGRRWLLTYGVELAMVKCLKSPEYQGILGHALGRAVDYGMQEEVDFPLVRLLKSKKDAGMDEVLDCFLLDGPLANLPEAAYLQPCLEQLSVPIYHADQFFSFVPCVEDLDTDEDLGSVVCMP